MATPLTSTSSTAPATLDAPQNSLRLHAALRTAGLRPTFHRLYVMRVLDQAAAVPVTAEQVYQQLNAMDVTVSQATVYRCLSELEQRGLLVRTRLQDASDNKVRYAVSTPARASRACTFTCQVCHEQSVVTDQGFCEQLHRQAQAAGFGSETGTIDITMTCKRCA